MFMKAALILYISLSLGYGLCVVAAKQKGILKTAGYALGIAILVLSLGHALVVSYSGKPCKPWSEKKECMMMKHAPDCPCCKAMK